MRHIRNFFHNINDIILAVIIVVLAVGIIYWRMQIILDYPKQLVNGDAAVSEEQVDDSENAAGEESATEETQAQGDEAADDEGAEDQSSDGAEESDGGVAEQAEQPAG